jgi:hypothetical protein
MDRTMKFVTRPPIDANGVGHGGDDLDEALFAFFRSEMPSPWPHLKLPDGTAPLRPAAPAPVPPSRSWFRSPRFALAASVALLIGGYAVTSAVLTPPAASDSLRIEGPIKANATNPKDVIDDDVDVKIESLDQIGNGPGTIHIKAERFEKK